MGGSVTEEPMMQPVSQYEEEVVEAEELAPDDAVEERELEAEEEVTIMPRQQTQTIQTKEKEAAPANNNEEWLSDFEGQLNIDMYQTKDNVIIKSTIAGVRPDDIDITVANDMLTVKGSRRKDENIPQDDYFYQECYWGNFSRSVIIPVDIESESIEV